MAADILIYDADYVPVGADQKQHVELARNLAERFNSRYEGEYFVVPRPLMPEIGAKIRDLIDPAKKMSKSADNSRASVFLLDDEKQIRRKIMSAKTDSDNVISFDENNKPGISNLLTIYSIFTGSSIDTAVARFSGAGYSELKAAVADAVIEKVTTIQDNYKKMMSTGIVDETLDKGRKYTNLIAAEKYELIRSIAGLGRD
jgi:tryptophanyl-tRNA synthetase